MLDWYEVQCNFIIICYKDPGDLKMSLVWIDKYIIVFSDKKNVSRKT